MELLAEVYASAFIERDDPEVAVNFGVDFALTDELHVLASGGTGLYGGAGARREWMGFIGLQLLLGPLFGDAAPVASAGSSPGGAALLELTNRQFRHERPPEAPWH